MALESKHPLPQSFKFAFDGLKTAIVKGRNFRIQLSAGFLAILLGLYFNLNSAEWLDLTIVISLVLILELINTSLEAIVDLVQPNIHEKAKIAKDVAAATVLVASISSIIVAILIFLPKIMKF